MRALILALALSLPSVPAQQYCWWYCQPQPSYWDFWQQPQQQPPPQQQQPFRLYDWLDPARSPSRVDTWRPPCRGEWC